MKRIVGRSTAILLGVSLLAGTAVAEETPADVSLASEINRYLEKTAPKWDDPKTMRAFWNNGLHLESGDGSFKMKIGGRLMWDNLWISSDDYSGDVTADRFFFRRVRMFMSGTVYKNVIFKVQLDFANQEEGEDGDATGKSAVAFKDVYMGLENLGPMTILIGHFKEPIGLEQLTSSKYNTFIERSDATEVFTPGRNVGFKLTALHLDKRLAWWAYFGKQTPDDGVTPLAEEGGYNLAVRVTGLAVQSEEHLLHVGGSFTYRTHDGQRFRSRPGMRTDRLVDTGTFTGDDRIQVGLELAWVWRGLSVQGEYFYATVSRPGGAEDVDFSGWYVTVSYWLTGESRPYNHKLGAFGRVKPKKSFWGASETGAGAWQIAYRFSFIDLESRDLAGGEQGTHTIGVNWHWNPNTRVMFNFVFSQQDPNSAITLNGAKTDISAFVIRWQLDF